METQAAAESRKVLASCNLCEAICGLELTIEDRPAGPKVVSVRGNPDDPLSRGHICPKGVALADVAEPAVAQTADDVVAVAVLVVDHGEHRQVEHSLEELGGVHAAHTTA